MAGAAASLAAGTPGASEAAEPPAAESSILISRVRIFDGRSDHLVPGAQVLIQGSRIAAIDTQNNPPPSDALVLDGNNRVLMPGLIDAHWHTVFAAVPMAVLLSADPGYIFAASAAEAERTLSRGFTTVRDLGGPVFSFKQAIDDGVIPGPRIFPSGAMITTSGGHADLRSLADLPRNPGQPSTIERMGGAAITDNPGELQLRIREQLLQGASQVKLVGGGGVSSPRSPLDMSTFAEDELRAAVGVARDWNTYVTVHAYAPTTVRRAALAGAACIEHGHLIDDDTARLLADRAIWLSTQPFLSLEDASPLPGPSLQKFQEVVARTPRVYELSQRYGIKTAWGSDLLFSPDLARRQGTMLTHLGRWLTNADTLRMATSVNAELLALSGERNPYPGSLGVIETNALADLLLVDGNPIEDLGLIENAATGLAVIIKSGRVHKNTLRS